MILYGQQLINVGASPNDKTGDPLRTAFQKVNSNLTAIYDSLDNKAPLIGTASGLTAGGIVRMARTPLSYFNFYSYDGEPVNVSHYYGLDGLYMFPGTGTYLRNYLDTTYLETGTVKFLNGNLGYTTGRLGKGWFTDLEVTNAIAGSITGNAATVTGFTRGTYSNSLALATTGGDAYTLTLTMRGADQNITMPNTSTGTLAVISEAQTFTGVQTFSSTISGNISGNAGTVTGYTPASGSLTLSGADAITLTTTAATSVTLPTSGTLATTTDTALGKVYSDTMSVSAGVLRTKTTTITTEPYNIMILDSDGNDITHNVKDSVALNGGVYKLYVYSVDALSGAKIKILY